MTLRPEPYAHLVHEKTFRSLDAFRKAAVERGVDMASLATAWVLAHPQTTAIITGPRSVKHLEMATAALEIELSDEDRAELASLFD